MVTLYETAHLRIRYEPHPRLLELQWLTESVDSAQLREGYQHALLLAERHQTRAWLSDFRLVPALSEDDMHWLVQHWYPRYVRLKLDKVAIVRPQHPDAHRELMHLVHLADAAGHTNRTVAEYFEDPAAARAWVRLPLVSGQLPPAG